MIECFRHRMKLSEPVLLRKLALPDPDEDGLAALQKKKCGVSYSPDGETQYMILSWDFSGQELIDMAEEAANAEIVE